MDFRNDNYWALILGGSSGFGLAAAHKLSLHGMNLCIVHRDRRAARERIEDEFLAIRNRGVELLTLNTDALSTEGRDGVLNELQQRLAETGGAVRLLLHSIAFGNLKLLRPPVLANGNGNVPAHQLLAERLGVQPEQVRAYCNELLEDGHPEFLHLADEPEYSHEVFLEDEDFAGTIYAMGTSLASYVREVHRRGLFAPSGRVLAMTSEGNATAWRGYAAVSAAKTALEAVARSIAVEYAPELRANIIQAGVTDTPALRLIPGSRQIVAAKLLQHPMGRITRPEDVAGVIALLCTDEADWINGEIIRVDGGERIAG